MNFFLSRISVRSGGILLASACFLSACDRVVPEAKDSQLSDHSAELIGSAVATTLMESLGGQLKGAMESGGPVGAVEVCREVAMPLTAAAGVSLEGVSVKRTSLKTRNPMNAPDAVDREVLETMAAQSPPQVTLRREGEVTRYYQPLVVQELCLKCHGNPATFPAELTSVLASLYPEDTATGYAVGDLRGAIRVDVKQP